MRRHCLYLLGSFLSGGLRVSSIYQKKKKALFRPPNKPKVSPTISQLLPNPTEDLHTLITTSSFSIPSDVLSCLCSFPRHASVQQTFVSPLKWAITQRRCFKWTSLILYNVCNNRIDDNFTFRDQNNPPLHHICLPTTWLFYGSVF